MILAVVVTVVRPQPLPLEVTLTDLSLNYGDFAEKALGGVNPNKIDLCDYCDYCDHMIITILYEV